MLVGWPSASAAARRPSPPGTKETRTGLSKNERWLAALLIVAGFAITVVVLAIFLTDGKWLIEESTTKGDGAAKTVTTKKYSDTLPLAAVAVGALLVLSGAFFGRLREVTVPGLGTLKLWQRQLEGKVEQRVTEAAKDQKVDPDEVDELKQVAHNEASALLLKQLAATSEPPPSEVLDDIAEKAVKSAISETAHRYDAIRAEMAPGGARDREMEATLAEAESAARAQKPTHDEIMAWLDASEPGARIKVLGAMKAHPDLRDVDLILRAVQYPLRPFDHDRFMVLAAEELRNLDKDHRRKLRELIEDQRAAGKIKGHHVRWATSERLLRLMAR